MAENNQTPIENEDDVEVISLVDEDGNEMLLEVLDEIEYNGTVYRAVIPYFENEEEYENADLEIVIMKVQENDGEVYLDVVEDDAEQNAVGKIFEEHLQDDFEFIEQ